MTLADIRKGASIVPIFSLAFVLAVALLAGAVRVASGQADSKAKALPQYVGAGGCSAPACHGSVRPMTQTPAWQNEYSIWVTQDKHSHAYESLSGPIAVRMAKILALPAANSAPKCLACHAIDAPPSARATTFDLSDGVSCENCHGAASGWLGPHTTGGWTHEQSVKLGMYDTRDIVSRTSRCLECHLGTKQKFVDHEMLAAGHPDLYFELDSFEATMPRHWKQPLDTDRWRDVRDWATGQAVQLSAEMKYLGDLTQRDVWPEYSQLDCFACHHSLVNTEDSWRQQRGYAGHRAGNAVWNPSRFIVFRPLAREVDPALAARLDDSVSKLQTEMNRLQPDREKVATAATEAASALDDFAKRIESLSYGETLTVTLMRDISGNADEISMSGERSAEQATMALNSLFLSYSRNSKPANDADLRAAIASLYQQLQSPSTYNGFQFAAEMRRFNAALR